MTKTILILAANPKGTPQLRLDQEVREIDNGLQRAQRRNEFAIRQVLAARPVDVRRAMLDFKPSIVHFCGHGKGKNGIAFEDETGHTKLVNAEALSGFFELFSDTVECVILNACYSEIQAEAIVQHINYVIGMKQGIGDEAAIEFAVAFYDALGAGQSIKFAYELGCNAIRWAGIPEHLTPILKQNKSPSQLKKISPSVVSSLSTQRDITGQWIDTTDNDVVFFKKIGKQVFGIYDFGERRKVGIYVGFLKGKVFEYRWEWLDRSLRGHGRMTLSDDGKVLSGYWWYGEKEVDVEHVEYQYTSDKMPPWLSAIDFKKMMMSF